MWLGELMVGDTTTPSMIPSHVGVGDGVRPGSGPGGYQRGYLDTGIFSGPPTRRFKDLFCLLRRRLRRRLRFCGRKTPVTPNPRQAGNLSNPPPPPPRDARCGDWQHPRVLVSNLRSTAAPKGSQTAPPEGVRQHPRKADNNQGEADNTLGIQTAPKGVTQHPREPGIH